MSKLHSSEKMLQIAGEVARVLRGLQTVAGVGFIGSVARREENPRDIDLVVLTTDQGLTEGLLKEAEEEEGHMYPSPGSWRGGMWSLGASVDLTDKTAAALDREQLHIVLMPSVPTDEYLNRFEAVQWDSDFLKNAAADYQRYDRESGEFVPARAPWQDYLDEQGAGEQSAASTEVFTLTRPRFGRRQVRTLRGISRGLILKDSWRGEIVVLGSSYERGDKEGAYGYDYAGCGKSGWYRNSVYCADVGVLSYEDGRWNRTNYLLRTGRRRLSEKETLAIEDTLGARGDKSGSAGQFISEYVCG